MLIGEFPGLQEMIDRSDAVVILRVDEDLDISGQSFGGHTLHRCLIYQTLKGDLAPTSFMPVLLYKPRSGVFVSSFPRFSNFLVFLRKIPDGEAKSKYASLEIKGSMFRLSPFGNERIPEGDTVGDKIRSVLVDSLAYWAEWERKEREFVERAMEEKQVVE